MIIRILKKVFTRTQSTACTSTKEMEKPSSVCSENNTSGFQSAMQPHIAVELEKLERLNNELKIKLREAKVEAFTKIDPDIREYIVQKAKEIAAERAADEALSAAMNKAQFSMSSEHSTLMRKFGASFYPYGHVGFSTVKYSSKVRERIAAFESYDEMVKAHLDASAEEILLEDSNEV